jgi:osmotically-inducible protein OsmY
VSTIMVQGRALRDGTPSLQFKPRMVAMLSEFASFRFGISRVAKSVAMAAVLTTVIQGSAAADRRGEGSRVQGGGEWDPYPVSEVEVPSIRANEEATRIQNALREQVHNRWYNVRVVSEPDQLALRGEVDSDVTRRELLKAAQSVSQRQVQDELTLRQPISDQEVKDSIARTLKQEHPELARELSIEVEDGRAKFHGNVANHRQIDAVLASALMQDGVRDVESDVTVRGRAYPRKIGVR